MARAWQGAFAPVATLPPTAILYALLRRAAFSLTRSCRLKGGIIFWLRSQARSDRYLIRPPPSGWLCAPRLGASRRSAPPAPCAAVLVHGSCYCKASIRYRNRYLPHPRTGEGSRLSHAFRRRKAVGFSGIFYALRAMPSKPTPFASSSTCNVSLCKGFWVPFGHYPRSLYIDFLPFNRYRLRRCSVLRRLRRLGLGIDFVDVIALSADGRKLPAHGVLT